MTGATLTAHADTPYTTEGIADDKEGMSNAQKLGNMLTHLSGKPPEKADINGRDEGCFFRRPEWDKEKMDLAAQEGPKQEIIYTGNWEPVYHKRVALAALHQQNMALLDLDEEAPAAIRRCVEGAKVLYGTATVTLKKRYEKTEVKVFDGNAIDTVISECEANKEHTVSALVFADSVNIGGAHPDGSRAQEEEVVYAAPTLSPALTLLAHKGGFYPLAEEGSMLVPKVLVHRKASYKLLDQKVNANMIFSAAPDRRDGKDGKKAEPQDRGQYLTLLESKIRSQFVAALECETDILVLGAYGCGVFKNASSDVSAQYKEVIDEFDGCFLKIVFPIFGGIEDTRENLCGEIVPNENKVFKDLAR